MSWYVAVAASISQCLNCFHHVLDQQYRDSSSVDFPHEIDHPLPFGPTQTAYRLIQQQQLGVGR